MQRSKLSSFRLKKSQEVELNKDENIINITLPRNHSCPRHTEDVKTDQTVCQTTINLFINEPHYKQINLKKVGDSIDGQFTLGKNIPNHALMKNLLGLNVKKFSSAPNVKYPIFKMRCNDETSSKTNVLFCKPSYYEKTVSSAEEEKSQLKMLNAIRRGRTSRYSIEANNFRSQMVKDRHKIKNLQSYNDELKIKHRSFLENLQNVNFDFVSNESKIELREKLNKFLLDKKGENMVRKPFPTNSKVCTVESHGSYKNYKQNLVLLPDGSYCCKDLCINDNNDETWSKSEINRIITADFIREKMRNYKSRFKEPPKVTKYFDNNLFPKNLPRPRGNFDQEKCIHEEVKFPKETRMAMNRLLQERQCRGHKIRNKRKSDIFTVSISNANTNS